MRLLPLDKWPVVIVISPVSRVPFLPIPERISPSIPYCTISHQFQFHRPSNRILDTLETHERSVPRYHYNAPLAHSIQTHHVINDYSLFSSARIDWCCSSGHARQTNQSCIIWFISLGLMFNQIFWVWLFDFYSICAKQKALPYCR